MASLSEKLAEVTRALKRKKLASAPSLGWVEKGTGLPLTPSPLANLAGPPDLDAGDFWRARNTALAEVLSGTSITTAESLAQRLSGKRTKALLHEFFEQRGTRIFRSQKELFRAFGKAGATTGEIGAIPWIEQLRQSAGVSFRETPFVGGPSVTIASKRETSRRELREGLSKAAKSADEELMLLMHEAQESVLESRYGKTLAVGGHAHPLIYMGDLEAAAMLGPKHIELWKEVQAEQVGEGLSDVLKWTDKERKAEALKFFEDLPTRASGILMERGYSPSEVESVVSTLRESLEAGVRSTETAAATATAPFVAMKGPKDRQGTLRKRVERKARMKRIARLEEKRRQGPKKSRAMELLDQRVKEMEKAMLAPPKPPKPWLTAIGGEGRGGRLPKSLVPGVEVTFVPESIKPTVELSGPLATRRRGDLKILHSFVKEIFEEEKKIAKSDPVTAVERATKRIREMLGKAPTAPEPGLPALATPPAAPERLITVEEVEDLIGHRRRELQIRKPPPRGAPSSKFKPGPDHVAKPKIKRAPGGWNKTVTPPLKVNPTEIGMVSEAPTPPKLDLGKSKVIGVKDVAAMKPSRPGIYGIPTAEELRKFRNVTARQERMAKSKGFEKILKESPEIEEMRHWTAKGTAGRRITIETPTIEDLNEMSRRLARRHGKAGVQMPANVGPGYKPRRFEFDFTSDTMDEIRSRKISPEWEAVETATQKAVKTSPEKAVQKAVTKGAQKAAEFELPPALNDYVSQSVKRAQDAAKLPLLAKIAPYAAGIAIGADVLASRDKTGPFWGIAGAGAAAWLTRNTSGAGRLAGIVGGYVLGRVIGTSMANSHSTPLSGFEEQGEASISRKQLTDFGSGWTGLLDVVEGFGNKVIKSLGRAMGRSSPSAISRVSDVGRAPIIPLPSPKWAGMRAYEGPVKMKRAPTMAFSQEDIQRATQEYLGAWQKTAATGGKDLKRKIHPTMAFSQEDIQRATQDYLRDWQSKAAEGLGKRKSTPLMTFSAQDVQKATQEYLGDWQRASAAEIGRKGASPVMGFDRDSINKAIGSYVNARGPGKEFISRPGPSIGTAATAATDLALSGKISSTRKGIENMKTVSQSAPGNSLYTPPSPEDMRMRSAVEAQMGGGSGFPVRVHPKEAFGNTLYHPPSPEDMKMRAAVESQMGGGSGFSVKVQPKEAFAETIFDSSNLRSTAAKKSAVRPVTPSGPAPRKLVDAPGRATSPTPVSVRTPNLGMAAAPTMMDISRSPTLVNIGSSPTMRMSASTVPEQSIPSGAAVGAAKGRTRTGSSPTPSTAKPLVKGVQVSGLEPTIKAFLDADPRGALQRRGHPKVLEGFTTGGVSGARRKGFTDFGTGWDPARRLAKSLGLLGAKEGAKVASRADDFKQILKAPKFTEALGRGKKVADIGAGGVGTVELMETTIGGESFKYARKTYGKALGVATPEELLERETRGLRALQDTISPTPYGRGEVISEGGQKMPAMYFEYIPEAVTADVAIAKQGGFKKKQIQDLEAGIRTLHEKGLTHSDIKPKNMLIDKEGRLVLIDPFVERLKASGIDKIIGEGMTLDVMKGQDLEALKRIRKGGEPTQTARELSIMANALCGQALGKPESLKRAFQMHYAQSILTEAAGPDAGLIAGLLDVSMKPSRHPGLLKALERTPIKTASNATPLPSASSQSASSQSKGRAQSIHSEQTAQLERTKGQVRPPRPQIYVPPPVSEQKKMSALTDKFTEVDGPSVTLALPKRGGGSTQSARASASRAAKRQKLHERAADLATSYRRDPSRQHRSMSQHRRSTADLFAEDSDIY